MKKTRGDSVLDALPPHQRDALESWLFEDNIPYKQALERLHQDFNVRSSLAALSGFYQRCAQSRLLVRIADSARKANAVVAQFEQNPSDSFRALLNMVGEIAFNKSMEKEVDADTLYSLTRMLIDARKLDQKTDELNLAREKFQRESCELFIKWSADQKATDIAKGNSSHADKIHLLGQMLFPDSWQ